MTTYSIKAPDGKLYTIDGPAGASQSDVEQEVMRQNPHLAGKPQPTEIKSVAQSPAESAQKASVGDIVAGLPATRFIAGAAAPVVGALQAGANIGDWVSQKLGNDPVFGKWLAEQIGGYEEAKKRGMAALGDTPTDIAGLVGSAGTGALALKGVAPATTYLGKVAQGAGVGAGAGATTPSSTPGLAQTGQQAVAGAVLGGGIPAVAPVVMATGRGIYRMGVEPLTKSGQQAIKGRAYLTAAGDKAPAIVQALRNPNQVIVPGSMPTAGEAAVSAGSAEFSALQKSASKVQPSDYLARNDAQKAARVAQLQTVGGTKAELAAAEATREAAALTNYDAAMTAGLDPQMAAAIQPQLESLLRRPSIQQAKATALRLAAERDLTITDFGSLEGLDWLKKGLDNQINIGAKQTSAVGKADLASLMQTKQDLLDTLKVIAPKYDAARATFAKDSIPINQMQVGQYLENKLVPAMGEDARQTATTFTAAVADAPRTIQRAISNSPRFKELTQVLTPKQVAAVNSVVDDLARGARFEDMARRGAQAGPTALDAASQSIEAAGGGGKIPNPLSRVVTIANAILNRLEGKINKKLALEIASEMLDPTKTANALEAAMQRGAPNPAMNALAKNRIPITVGGVQVITNQGQ